MIDRRPFEALGHADHGWLKARHHFSFADYRDPERMRWGSLRIWNDDEIAPESGFPPHPHRDMEIITYVLEGGIAHNDSMGNGSIIRPGDGQRMSAGTGVRHSEANSSKTDPVRLLQIWIMPDRRGHEPGYEQKSFPEEEKRGKLRVIASPDGADGSVTIHQDARLYVSLLSPGQEVEHTLAAGRFAWLQIAKGAVELNGHSLKQGDGASADESNLKIKATAESEILLFDLA
jgi:hypothetical protein